MLAEIPYAVVGQTVENAYREGRQLILTQRAVLPDTCVICGNPAYGNVLHKVFPRGEYLWILPTPLDLIALLINAFVAKYSFDFPFCSNCHGVFLSPVRIDNELAVFNGASERFLDFLPPVTAQIAWEKNRDWIDRKFRKT